MDTHTHDTEPNNEDDITQEIKNHSSKGPTQQPMQQLAIPDRGLIINTRFFDNTNNNNRGKDTTN